MTTEPYYSAGDMYRTLWQHRTGPKLHHRAEERLRSSYLNIAWRSWRRLIPHFSPETSRTITEIEQERGNNGNTFSKKYRTDSLIRDVIIRDTPLYEFYVGQSEEGLKQVFHGMGRKAILGVGATLFKSGEHDDLVYAAEQLEEMLASDAPTATK